MQKHAALVCRHNLQPMVTLHHFVHPNWFERLGGFTKEENIPHFVHYCQAVFRYSPLVKTDIMHWYACPAGSSELTSWLTMPLVHKHHTRATSLQSRLDAAGSQAQLHASYSCHVPI